LISDYQQFARSVGEEFWLLIEGRPTLSLVLREVDESEFGRVFMPKTASAGRSLEDHDLVDRIGPAMPIPALAHVELMPDELLPLWLRQQSELLRHRV
jgi:hypothetical protein